MNYNTAQEKHKEQWLLGGHIDSVDDYVFPYNFLYEDDEFIEVEIQIKNCETQNVSASLVDKYIALERDGTNLGPSWVIFGKKLQNGDVSPFWHNKCYVVDGNHRVVAKNKQGIKTIDVIIPESNYIEYKRKYNE